MHVGALGRCLPQDVTHFALHECIKLYIYIFIYIYIYIYIHGSHNRKSDSIHVQNDYHTSVGYKRMAHVRVVMA